MICWSLRQHWFSKLGTNLSTWPVLTNLQWVANNDPRIQFIQTSPQVQQGMIKIVWDFAPFYSRPRCVDWYGVIPVEQLYRVACARSRGTICRRNTKHKRYTLPWKREHREQACDFRCPRKLRRMRSNLKKMNEKYIQLEHIKYAYISVCVHIHMHIYAQVPVISDAMTLIVRHCKSGRQHILL